MILTQNNEIRHRKKISRFKRDSNPDLPIAGQVCYTTIKAIVSESEFCVGCLISRCSMTSLDHMRVQKT
jgi:hypothetical protein